MSSETVLKIFFVGLFSLIIAWNIFFRYDAEIGTDTEDSHQKYTPFLSISGYLLPTLLGLLLIITLGEYGFQETLRLMLSLCFPIFLHISLYYLLLIPLLPFLRKHINARVCALLWLLPNYLYLTQQGFMAAPKPLFVIRVPEKWLWVLFCLWMLGFCIVFSRHILSHLCFRSRILKNAVPVEDAAVLELWTQELQLANIRSKRIKLVISPEVTTPLSVGLFRCRIRVVLPQKPYTQEELTLILRHEIVHISREDSWSKFFLLFCTAMCWFNPLMRIAMQKSAEDLELSCDEVVLLDADEVTRRRYAALILNTAGDERGFTTCLSASATALRYRLKSIMKPQPHHSGALVAALVFFLLFMSFGFISLSYESGTGAELIYQSESPSLYKLSSIMMNTENKHSAFVCTDTAALEGYLSGLTMDTIIGNYSFSEDSYMTLLYETPKGTLAIVLYDSVIKLVPLNKHNQPATYYYLPEQTNWAYIHSLLVKE